MLNFNNKYCPRDAKDQVKYFKTLNYNILKKRYNFLEKHVAVALSKNN